MLARYHIILTYCNLFIGTLPGLLSIIREYILRIFAKINVMRSMVVAVSWLAGGSRGFLLF